MMLIQSLIVLILPCQLWTLPTSSGGAGRGNTGQNTSSRQARTSGTLGGGGGKLPAMLAAAAPRFRANNDDGEPVIDSLPLDRHLVIACTNRHNCESTCRLAKGSKFHTKTALLNALTATLGDGGGGDDSAAAAAAEAQLTDAHKLGLQFGMKRSCDKCSLIYSNCDNQLYGLAQRQLFSWRASDTVAMPSKLGNTL